MLKLFNVGLPKSGTTTATKAFRKAGLTTAHWRHGDLVIGQSLSRNYFKGRDPMHDMPDVDVVTQADFFTGSESYWPQMNVPLLLALRRYHPDCKILLLKRDPVKTMDSIVRWNKMQQRLNKIGAPGLPPGFAKDASTIVKWIEGHFETMRTIFGDTDYYLEIDLESDTLQEQLSEFIGVDLPWWGHRNENASAAPSPKKRQKATLRTDG